MDRDWKFMALCPCHDDRLPSLSFWTRDQRLLFKCHAGCHKMDILKALGLRWGDCFMEDGKEKGPIGTLDKAYSYLDRTGTLVYQVLRFRHPKDFRVRRPGADRKWIWNLDGIPKILYHLDLLADWPRSHTVFIVEGEKKADYLLSQWGLLATTNSGGTGTEWLPEWAAELRGRNVVVIPDNDYTGRKHAARTLGQLLLAGVHAVRLLEIPGLENGQGIDDWWPGKSRDDFLALVKSCPCWRSVS